MCPCQDPASHICSPRLRGNHRRLTITVTGHQTAVTMTGTMAGTMVRHLRRIRGNIRASIRVNIKVSIRGNIRASTTPVAVTGMTHALVSRAIHRMTSAMQTEAAMEGRGVKHVCSAVGFSA